MLHTRASEPLDDAIREAAGELRVPVSNLVRNVLEDVFEVVENVTDNVGDIVDDVLGDVDRVRTRFSRDLRQRREAPGREQAEIERWEAEAEGRAAGQREGDPAKPEPETEIERAPFPEIVGWQPLILNGDQGCADCARELGSGDRGFAGLGESGLSGVYLCGACMDARS